VQAVPDNYYPTNFGNTLISLLDEITQWGRALGKKEGKVVDQSKGKE
jgi:DNA-binding HxlR family transcriptional regulator